ncbi:MAG: glycoside hydrolase [Calditrichaeota bacterium]|nr:MAG: glycoside hydrolase [Calditrichota bacterium]
MIKPILILLLILAPLQQDQHLQIKLPDQWRYEIGDNPAFALPTHDESQWRKIKVPSLWENAGFPGYDGFAWYRVWFLMPEEMPTDNLYLKLGRIDDVDEVFLNGHFFASSGHFPPEYETAWDQQRLYKIPAKLLLMGKKNLLAVRVYDFSISGGIYEGPIGIYNFPGILDLKINCSGTWKFCTGDSLNWKESDFADSKWSSAKIPGEKEIKNQKNPSGIAWYRKKIKIPSTLAGENLVFALGKIKDCDRVYFNGQLIGSTGFREKNHQQNNFNGFKNIERFYSIPTRLVHFDAYNTVAIRVSTSFRKGGIYRGQVGITTASLVEKYKRGKN